jgi:hypothetical protein
MTYVKALFKWERYAMVYDVDSVYRATHNAIATALRDPEPHAAIQDPQPHTHGEKKNMIMSTHGVYDSQPDDEIRDIYLQIRKYARSEWI